MSSMDFAKGMGLGLGFGMTAGLAMQKKKKTGRSMVGKTAKAVGDVADYVSDLLGL